MKTCKLVIILVFISLITYGCVPGDGTHNENELAGFFWGIWHGFIAPISLIFELFNGKYSIYEYYNNGFFYDLGYYIAVISEIGGLSISTGSYDIRRKKNNSNYN